MTEALYDKLAEICVEHFQNPPDEIGSDNGVILQYDSVPENKVQLFANFLQFPEFDGMEWSEGKLRTYWKDTPS